MTKIICTVTDVKMIKKGLLVTSGTNNGDLTFKFE